MDRVGIKVSKKILFLPGTPGPGREYPPVITDEFGIFDLATLMIATSLLILLLVTRSEYLAAP